MNLTQTQRLDIIEARLRLPRPTWKAVSEALGMTPAQLRRVRQSREYLDDAYAQDRKSVV